MMSSSCRHKKDLQPAGALCDGLPPVVGAPSLGEGHVHRVLIDGAHVEQRRVDGQLLVLAGLLVVEDVQDMPRGKLVHDEVRAAVDAAVQRRGVHEERDLRPVVQPHAVAVLVKHQTKANLLPGSPDLFRGRGVAAGGEGGERQAFPVRYVAHDVEGRAADGVQAAHTLPTLPVRDAAPDHGAGSVGGIRPVVVGPARLLGLHQALTVFTGGGIFWSEEVATAKPPVRRRRGFTGRARLPDPEPRPPVKAVYAVKDLHGGGLQPAPPSAPPFLRFHNH